ncbi:MAG TPA: hypothetical protein VF021_06530 [Longimicrobiales bacterium]
MKSGIITAVLLLSIVPAALHAQSPAKRTMHERLMPEGAALTLTAPVAEAPAATRTPKPVAVEHGTSIAYMIVGGALFAGGLIAGGDAGTVLILAGAGVGAYGLYLYFR